MLPNREKNAREKSVEHFYTNTQFWNQVKKKKIERERWRKKRERMRATPTSARTFLNEEEKENKRGIEIRTTCVKKKKKEKKIVWMK